MILPDSGLSQPTGSRRGRRTLMVVLALVVLLLAGLAAVLVLPHHKEPPARSGRRTIGESVQGRAIQVVSFGPQPVACSRLAACTATNTARTSQSSSSRS